MIGNEEYFFFAYTDDGGHFRFQSGVKKKHFEESFKNHNLCTVNSFYKKSRRKDCLKIIYAILIDFDGWSASFPLSHINILEIWDEYGFMLPPSQIIRTSEGRYHMILNIEPIPAYPRYISYHYHISKGICKLFSELKIDVQASTNPIGLVRIPEHPNYKYDYKPIVESVYETDSVFTLSVINEVLKDNEIIKPKPSNKSENERIKILENGVNEGQRDHTCFTLAIIYKNQGLSRKHAEDKLIEWGMRCNPPFSEKLVFKTVKSAYEKDYIYYRDWLYQLTNDLDNSPSLIKKKPKDRKRICILEHKSKLEKHINDHRGIIRSSQSKISEILKIPIRSLKKIIAESDNIKAIPIGKGRNAYTVFELVEASKTRLQMVQ